MPTPRPGARAHAVHGDGSIFPDLLRGCRFRVCDDGVSAARALEVRRRVYQGACGYEVPIPDEYDLRSWLLLAEDADTGAPVGSMRVTPRSAGPVEAEEYFELPDEIVSPHLVEVTRFAVLPTRDEGGRGLPAVALGLLKLSARFVRLLGADRVVICSRMDRVHFYTWLGFQPTGMVAAYQKLSGLEHALLTCDLRCLEAGTGRGRWKLLGDGPPGEILLPAPVPALGLGVSFPARAVRRPPAPTRNRKHRGSRPQERPFLVPSRKHP